MGRECSTFYNRITKMIVEKQELHLSIVTNWIQTKISSLLLKSALCLCRSKRLSRSVCFVGDNIEVAYKAIKI